MCFFVLFLRSLLGKVVIPRLKICLVERVMRVLLVENDPQLSSTIQRILSHEGYIQEPLQSAELAMHVKRKRQSKNSRYL